MKLHLDNHGFEGNLPENRIAMKIKSSAKMFSILSDGIYKDKILAVIREYVCNAYDAHVSVGKRDVPFTVRLPCQMESTFSVIDEGTGVDPAMIGEIFWTYGESSKTDDDQTIGALGLGSKSAFAYTKSSFVVKNRYQGNEYTYFCFINENGEPEGSMVGQEPTTEKNGITVEFAVRPEDHDAFYERFGRIFKYWANVKPNIIGVEASDVLEADPTKVVEGDRWYLEASDNYDRHPALAIMGNVCYPIESASIPNLPTNLKIIADNPFVITFPLGDLEFASSRESLSYTEFTCKQLINRLEEVRAELAESFHAKVFTASKDHLSFYHVFAKTFAEFRKVVYAKSSTYRGTDDSINETFIGLLLGRSLEDQIEFLGTKFSIENLINNKYASKYDHHQSFGLYTPTYHGRNSSRFHYSVNTSLTMRTVKEIERNMIYPSYSIGSKLSVGSEPIRNHDWRSNYISPRTKIMSDFEHTLKNQEFFSPISSNSFSIDLRTDQLVFIINDTGSTGRDRMKALFESHSVKQSVKLESAQLIYVEFNSKVSDLSSVSTELNSLINMTLTGASVRLLSQLPDARAPIKKEKVDKDSIKLMVQVLEQSGVITQSVAGEYFSDSINLKINKIVSRGVNEKIVLISDLSSRSVVPFVIKRRVRNKFFEDVNITEDACTTNEGMMGLAWHLGVLNDMITEDEVITPTRCSFMKNESTMKKRLNVLVINEGQHAYLLKKGVKLIPVAQTIKSRMKVMNEAEKFVELIERFAVLSRVKHLKGMYNGLILCDQLDLTEGFENSSSLYKVLFSEYRKLRVDSKDNVEMFAKLELLKMVNEQIFNNLLIKEEASRIQHNLNNKYPMLEYITYDDMYFNSNKGKKVITYVEQIDLLISQAIVDTNTEVAEDLPEESPEAVEI